MSGAHRHPYQGWYVVTMNPTRDIIRHGAVAIRGREIVAVGKASDLEAAYEPAETVGGDRFVVTPGLVNTHIHITGEPLTQGLCPRRHTVRGERVHVAVSALLGPYRRRGAACRPSWLRSRCSSRARPRFLEAGTIRFVDEVMDGPGRPSASGAASASGYGTCPRSPTSIKQRHRRGDRQPQRHHREIHRGTGRWPVGARGRWWSATPPAPTRCGAPPAEAADQHGVGLNFHMSPATARSRRLHCRVRTTPHGSPRTSSVCCSPDTDMTHCVHVDDNELDIMAAAACSVEHCPTTALKVSLRRDPDREDPRDGDAGYQREHRHRRQQRLELLPTCTAPPIWWRGCSRTPAWTPRCSPPRRLTRWRPSAWRSHDVDERSRSGRSSWARRPTSSSTTPTGRSGDLCST